MTLFKIHYGLIIGKPTERVPNYGADHVVVDGDAREAIAFVDNAWTGTKIGRKRVTGIFVEKVETIASNVQIA